MNQTQSGSDKMKVIRKNRASAGMVTLALAGLALTALLTQSFACGASMKVAKESYQRKMYRQAADQFVAVASAKKTGKESKQEATMLAAESYRMANQFEMARKWYERALRKEPKNTRALLMSGIILQKQEKYREAMDMFDKYLQEVPGDSMALRKKLGCELALRWTPDSSRYKVSEFKIANTRQSDYAPMIASKNDNVLYITSDREGGVSKRMYGWTGDWYTDIWMLELKGKKDKAKWGKPMLINGANTKYNDGVVNFNTNFQTMYFTQCNGASGKERQCKIYSTQKVGDGWGEPVLMPFCADSFNYGHPGLTEDGNKMYFTSDRPGGFGGYDIWVSDYTKRGKTWSVPTNLGSQINTESNEMYPYWNKHENELFFSSNGLPGMGGLDIFRAKPTESVVVWEEVENLKEPINSGGDDFGITFDEKKSTHGFFSSNRSEGGKKSDDNIYEFTVEPLVFTLSGIVTDCDTKLPLKGATVVIINDRDTSKMRIKTDEMGYYKVDLKVQTSYEVQAIYPEKYYFESGRPVQKTTRGLKRSADLKQDFCLRNPLTTIIVLPIYYDLDKAIIRPDAQRILDEFADNVMKKYPKLTIELGSHTDCRATEEYNVNLSNRRADSAVAYLVKKGVDARRMVFKGYGETELMNDCKCEGTAVTGMTRYRGRDAKLGIDSTRKLIVEEINGSFVSRYEEYKPSEIKVVNGVKYVPCDEYQHQQNRRTTIKFTSTEFDPNVKVAPSGDLNNANKGTENKDTVKPQAPAGPVIDESNATRVKVATEGNRKYINGMVNDKEPVKWNFDLVGRTTAVPEDVVKAWYEQKIITKADFLEGDKVQLKDGTKLPSKVFELKKVEIGGYTMELVKITISDKVEFPTLGKSAFKDFKAESYEKDGTLVLIPKKVKKPVESKPTE
ncbi:MAG: OmpA family protein [Bacteroidetes bacterium]|nr:OmpA family protein [Bacteroidota bacterium]